jgi:hypothetical protein
MRPCRGMGAVNPSKLPKKIVRKDNPNSVDLYRKGGVAKNFPPATKFKQAKK